MEDLEKRLAVAAWWAPFYVLFAVSYKTMSPPVRRHVWWAAIYLAVFFVFAMSVIFVSSSLLDVAGLAIVIIALVGLGVPSLNTLAVLNDRGPFFIELT